jgi:hypothetical protein
VSGSARTRTDGPRTGPDRERGAERGAAYRGLHVLVDDDPRWGRDPVEQARAACRAGVPVIQLRAKHAGDRKILAWAS